MIFGTENLKTDPDYELSGSSKKKYQRLPDILETDEKNISSLAQSEKNIASLAQKKISQRTSLEISAIKNSVSQEKNLVSYRPRRSSTICEPRSNKIKPLNLSDLIIEKKTLGEVKENHEILNRKNIKREIIFAMNFLDGLYSIPELVANTNQEDHFLLKSLQSINSSAESFDYITSINMKATKHNVYFCFNDEGELIKLNKLLESIKLEKSSKIIKKEIDVILHERKYEKNCLQPVDLNLSDNERKCYNMLLKLHPNKNGTLVFPLLLLITYEKFVSTDQLILLIALAIESPDISFIQKMRILNFVQTLLKFKSIDCEKTEVKSAFNKVIAACNKTNVVEIIQFCKEIELVFNSEKLTLKKNSERLLNTDVFIDKFMNVNCESVELEQFIAQITDDLKLISAFSVYNTMPDDLMGNHEYPASIFWNKLHSHIKNVYKKQLKESEENPEASNLRLSKFIHLLTQIASSLIKKHEYLASNAIYCFLSRFEGVAESKKTAKKTKKRLSLSGSRHKSTEKIDSSFEIFPKLEELTYVHAPNALFKNMRELIIECRLKRRYFVPHVTPYSLMAQKELEYFKLKNLDSPKNEMEEFFQKSLIISNLNKIIFEDLRFHTEKECKKKRLNTDIYKKLYPEEN